jgi:predicted  nucleic acid-binding Zn-ribbon protein
MTEQTRTALKELQDMDRGIQAVKERIARLETDIVEVDAPARELEEEVENTRKRLKEMRVDERRLELSTQDKESRIEKLEERLNNVRNVREESAVRSEIDMVKQALAGDEQEVLSLLEQIRNLELKLEEQESAFEQARTEVGPRREELEAARDEALAELEEQEADRSSFTTEMPRDELRLYEGIRKGGAREAVASLTADGACGNCFGVLPLQAQNEVRHGSSLVRCEVCGVILALPGAEESEEEEGEGVQDPAGEEVSGEGGDASPSAASGDADADRA